MGAYVESLMFRKRDVIGPSLVGGIHKFVAGTQSEYIKHAATVCWISTTFVFAWFEDFPFRHDFLPILFRLTLPGDFLEFECSEMGVTIVLGGNTSVSSERRWIRVGYTLDLNLNPIDEMRDINWSTFSNRLETSAILSCPLYHAVGSRFGWEEVQLIGRTSV